MSNENNGAGRLYTLGRHGLMAVSAFRYCLGRQTYIVSDCVDWLAAEWAGLPANVRHIIARELRDEVRRDDEAREAGANYKPLGHDIDRADWLRLLAHIEREEGAAA